MDHSLVFYRPGKTHLQKDAENFESSFQQSMSQQAQGKPSVEMAEVKVNGIFKGAPPIAADPGGFLDFRIF